METDFTSVRKSLVFPWKNVLLFSAPLKRVIYAISENCFYDKGLPKLPDLPNVFVFFINVGHFVIIEEDVSFLFGVG